MLTPWPLLDESMEAVVGNRLPGFSPDEYAFIAREALRVLRVGGQIRLFSLSMPVLTVQQAVDAAGFVGIRIEDITVIGSK